MVNSSSAVHRCSVEDGMIVAASLEDRPETVFAAQRLRRGLCPAYLLGSLTAYDYVIVEVFPEQLLGCGSDLQALWQLLQVIPGGREWKSLGVAPDQATAVAALLGRRGGRTLRTQTVIYSRLFTPVPVYQHSMVRLLDTHEVELASTGPGGSIGAAYGSPQALLAEGWVSGAVVDGELVARAHTSCHSATYADVAIATREQWQGQGLATAAASLVCQHVQQNGRTPIWSTTMDNLASRRVAQKLGFQDYSQLTYLIAVTASN
jgi:GNAT superfamily N-acetyltransferase